MKHIKICNTRLLAYGQLKKSSTQAKKSIENQNFFSRKNPSINYRTQYQKAGHISGNKSRIGSMEVSIYKEYKDTLTVNSLRCEKNKKQTLKGPDRQDRMCQSTQKLNIEIPSWLLKIVDQYDSRKFFKNAVNERASSLGSQLKTVPLPLFFQCLKRSFFVTEGERSGTNHDHLYYLNFFLKTLKRVTY